MITDSDYRLSRRESANYQKVLTTMRKFTHATNEIVNPILTWARINNTVAIRFKDGHCLIISLNNIKDCHKKIAALAERP